MTLPPAALVLDNTATGGGWRCELRPDLGGCIAGLWWRGEPVLRQPPPEGLSGARQSASYPLVPFSNRIERAVLHWQGTDHPLVQNNAPEPHAIHGVGWQRPWSVLEHSADHALLSFEHAADAHWPFAFDASQTVRLHGNTLELVLGLTNQADHPAPAGLGWHPWFIKRPQAHLAFEATARWEMGDDKLPTHRTPSTGLHAAAAALDLDHCFEGWRGLVTLRDPRLTVRVRSSTPYLVVCTQPSRDAVAIEPVSHVNNALALQQAGGRPAAELGLRTLAPGESLVLQMSIEVSTDEGSPA
ncbi:aldose 1-epimerase [Curvibacter sp. RS43]|uniref:Aldose 1-epimerase n=1 Tax=Curvibacter microcysteis TaxID=3026419 RepID=A0ABT5MBA5_9BURK|nr:MULTISPECIES: aldose 1-epimerase [unclassified Curvibacter]MDD0811180.1 aldose 1-epimerase [Curvibacter sp. RS43]MDD0813848.1 aldose 1-epimerase [Curvibacter sp. HBC28]